MIWLFFTNLWSFCYNKSSPNKMLFYTLLLKTVCPSETIYVKESIELFVIGFTKRYLICTVINI